MFVAQENIVCTLKWPILIYIKMEKIFDLRRKSLIGLTPVDFIQNEVEIKGLRNLCKLLVAVKASLRLPVNI